jgi:hypothetical protein
MHQYAMFWQSILNWALKILCNKGKYVIQKAIDAI